MSNIDKNGYYDFNDIWNTGRPLMMILGTRGKGKTYGAKKLSIRQFVKKGTMFLYLTRFTNDLDFLKGSCFNDVENEINELFDEKLETKGLKVYLGDDLVGEIMSVNQYTKIKKISRPKTDLIIYDEFLQEKGGRYIKNEPEKLLNIASSVFRNRENVRILCLANFIEYANPYFEYFGVIPLKGKLNLYQNIAIDIIDPGLFKDKKEDMTSFNSLISQTGYGESAQNGKFHDESLELIRTKLTRSFACKFTILFEGKKYGVWFDKYNDDVIISKKHDRSVTTFVISRDEIGEQGAFKAWYKSGLMKRLFTARNKNVIFYSDVFTRKYAVEILTRLGVY